jgi:hypothetical protein
METIEQHTSGPLNLLADDQRVKQFGIQYRQGLKIAIEGVVQNGYDSNARKYSCEGKLTVSTLRGQVYSIVTSYESQALAEGNGKFLVRVAEGTRMAEAVGQDFVEYVASKTGGGRTVAEVGTSAPSSREQCIEQRATEVERQINARDEARATEAAKTNAFFKPTPLGEVEEAKDAARKAAEAACQ